MSDGRLSINIRRRKLTGETIVSVVRHKPLNSVSVVLELDELDATEFAIAEARRRIASGSYGEEPVSLLPERSHA